MIDSNKGKLPKHLKNSCKSTALTWKHSKTNDKHEEIL